MDGFTRYHADGHDKPRCPQCGGIFTEVVTTNMVGTLAKECGHRVIVMRIDVDPHAWYVKEAPDLGHPELNHQALRGGQ